MGEGESPQSKVRSCVGNGAESELNCLYKLVDEDLRELMRLLFLTKSLVQKRPHLILKDQTLT